MFAFHTGGDDMAANPESRATQSNPEQERGDAITFCVLVLAFLTVVATLVTAAIIGAG